MTGWRRATVWAAILPMAMVGAPLPAAGSAPGNCSPGRPHPECAGFWITDFTLEYRLDQTAPGRGGATSGLERIADRTVMTFDLGYMRNQTAPRALGGSVFLSAVDLRAWSPDRMRVGLRARHRWWFGRDWMADISLGPAWTAPNLQLLRLDRTGGDLAAAVSYRDYIGLTLGVHAGPLERGGAWENEWRAGLRAGSTAGVASASTAVLLGVGFLVALAVALSSGT